MKRNALPGTEGEFPVELARVLAYYHDGEGTADTRKRVAMDDVTSTETAPGLLKKPAREATYDGP